MTTDQDFSYKNCQFTCSAVRQDSGNWQHRVLYRTGFAGLEQMGLPADTDAYGSEAEALRHAEQQAVRWVHDRTGDGKGRF